MTNPLQIIPADVHAFAQDQRIGADGFMTAPPPVVPGDPAGPDPTVGSSQNLINATDQARRSLRDRSHRHADASDAAAAALQAQDEENAGNIARVAPGDQYGVFNGVHQDLKAGGKVAQGIDAGGAGTLINAFLGPAAQVASGLSQGLNGLMGAATQGVSTMAGQVFNVAGQMGSATVKATPASTVGSDKHDGHVEEPSGGGAAATRPASGSAMPLQASASPSSGFFGHHPGAHGDDVVQPAQQPGIAMPAGMGSGLAGMGASGGGASGKVRTAKVVTATDRTPDDPPTAPLPVFEIAKAVAARKDT